MLFAIKETNKLNSNTATIITPFLRSHMGPCVLNRAASFCHWAKIIFAGKLRNPSFCHIVGMERPNFFLKTGRDWLDIGFKIGLNKKLSMCKETSENIF